jgi:NAD(P)H-hydrate epimerase
MGLGSASETAKGVKKALPKIEKPLVLDADALNAYSGNLDELGKAIKAQPRRVILTPHPGEMARLMGTASAEVQANRLDIAQACARQTGAIVVLKGHATLVVDGGSPEVIYKNATGNSGMGKGGTGDILAGMIGGLIAQGLHAFEAACLGVHLHGLAGDRAAEALGEHSMVAGDLIEHLPAAIQQYAG